MSELNRTQLTAENNASFPNNNTGFITPDKLRTFNQDVVDSMAFQSQVDSIQTDLDALVLSGSGVVVQEDGVSLGPVTDLNFSGSAVNVTVTGSVATIDISPSFVLDGYTTTASFNAFTSSQNSFNTAATASIVALQNFSSSLDATFATDAQLNASSSTLQANINTKLNTSSFNSFTQSYNTFSSSVANEINSLQDVSGSYATTGSNTFNGNQLFNGSLNVTGDITASKLLVQVETSSIIYSSGSNQFGDASNDVQTLFGTVNVKTGPLVVTGSLLQTGSLIQVGNSSLLGNTVLSGSVEISGSTKITGTTNFSNSSTTITGSLLVSGSTTQVGNIALLGNSTLSGSVFVSGNIEITNGKSLIAHTIKAAGSNGLELLSNSGATIASAGAGGSNQIAFGGQVSTGGNLSVSGSVSASGAFTASLSEGYVWVGGAGNRTTLVATSSFGGGGTIDTGSFATTGSNTFTGNQTIQNGQKLITDTIEAGAPYGLTIQGGGAAINLGGPSYGDPVKIFSNNPSIDTNGNRLSVSGSIDVSVGITALNGEIQAQTFSGDGGSITNVNAYLLDGNMATTFATTGSNTFTAAQSVTNGAGNTSNVTPIAVSNVDTSGGMGQTKNITLSANPSTLGGPLSSWTEPTLYGIGNAGPYQIAEFQSQGNYTDGTATFKKPLIVSGSIIATGNISAPNLTGSVVDTSSLATTGSNTFEGNQTINGDAIVTGSVQTDNINAGASQLVVDATSGISLAMQGEKLGVSGSIQANGTISSLSGFSGNGSNLTSVDAATLGGLSSTDFAVLSGGNTFDSTQTVSNGAGNTSNISSITISNVDGSGGAGQAKNITLSANPSTLGGPLAAWTQPTLYGIGSAGPYQIAEFQSQGNYTDGRTSFKTPMVVTGSFTASLQQGYAWVGGAGGVSTSVPTSSFGGGSGVGFPFTGSAQITGSLGVTGSILVQSGSASGSVVTNVGDTYTTVGSVQKIISLTQSEYNAIGTKDANTLYVISGSATLAPTFPYTGSAVITGSLVITGSAEMNVVNLSIVSNTASIDLNAGNYFSGSLSGSVFFNITNARPGETAIVKLSTTGVPTASFSSNVRQISGSAYVATSGSGQTDILTLVSMDTTNVFLLNSKRFI